MKRKIGLIIALILALAGVSVFNGGEANATGVNGDIYCAIDYIRYTHVSQCAYILKT